MAYPIVTFVIAAGLAFLAFQTNRIETGMADESMPSMEDAAPPADDRPVEDDGAE